MTQKLKLTITDKTGTREATHPEYVAWLQLEEGKHLTKICQVEFCRGGCSECIIHPMCHMICSGHCKHILEGKTILVGVVGE